MPRIPIPRHSSGCTLWRAKTSIPVARRQYCFNSHCEISVQRPFPPINRVRSVVEKLLPDGHPKLTMVAEALDLSPRTLQRGLAAHRLTHSQLVNQARLNKACQLLSKHELEINEIARATGFATPSGFSRAFQTWTGKSPRSFRQELS